MLLDYPFNSLFRITTNIHRRTALLTARDGDSTSGSPMKGIMRKPLTCHDVIMSCLISACSNRVCGRRLCRIKQDANGVASAVCFCPTGFVLDARNTTCQGRKVQRIIEMPTLWSLVAPDVAIVVLISHGAITTILNYTPRNEVEGGILDSPCSSVRPSVRLSVCPSVRPPSVSGW